MPDMRALLGKMRWALSHRLGPLVLALLVGCSGSTQILRLEPGQPEPIVHIAPGDRAPVRVDSAVFQEAFSTHALQVQPASQPLQQARRLWLLPSRSAPNGDRPQYVGITNDLARRATEQLRHKGIHIDEFMTGLSREDARAVEQALIELHGLQRNGGTLLNRINSIARSNPKYAAMLQRGLELLESIGYLDGQP